MGNGVLIGNLAGTIEFVERLIEGLHSLFVGLTHQVFQRCHVTFANQVSRQRRIQQNFHTGATPLPVAGRNQLLRHHGFEVERQIHPQLSMPLRRKEVQNAIQRLVGIVGVKRTQTEVPRFSEGNGMLHGFTGTHLADHDHIRRLPQHVLQRHFERLGINAHFPLSNDAPFVLVHEFDGIFHGDNVAATVLVAVPDHRRQRGGLTRSRRPDKNNQPALGHRQVFDNIRQTELIRSGNLRFDTAQHHADQIALIKSADPEATDPSCADREVALVIAHKLAALLLVHHAHHGFPRLFGAQRITAHRNQLAVQLH